MKKLMITATAMMMAVAAYGQGQFLFNTRDITAGNNVTFVSGANVPITGADFFVEVLAGTSATALTPLTPLLPLNRTGAGAGYTQPFGQTYNAPAGSTLIAYRAYQGTSYDTSANRSEVVTVNQMLNAAGTAVTLSLPTDPTAPPPELALGVRAVTVGTIPEPATLALGLIGLGTILMFRRRQ